jgi:hypothetical protein
MAVAIKAALRSQLNVILDDLINDRFCAAQGVSNLDRCSLILDSASNINIAPDVESGRFGWTFGFCE